MKIEDIQEHEDEGVLSFPLDRRGRKLLKPGAFDGLRLNIRYEITDGAPGSGASSNGYETPASMPSLSESSLLDHQVRDVMQRNLRAASERNFRRTPGASSISTEVSISDRSTSPDSTASMRHNEDMLRRLQGLLDTQPSQPSPPTLRARPIPVPTNNNNIVREVIAGEPVPEGSERNFGQTTGASNTYDRSDLLTNSDANNDEDIVEYPLSSRGFRRFQALETQRSQPSPPTLRAGPVPVPTNNNVREVMETNIREASERNFRRTPGASSNYDEDTMEYIQEVYRRFQAPETQRSQPTLIPQPIPVPTSNNDDGIDEVDDANSWDYASQSEARGRTSSSSVRSLNDGTLISRRYFQAALETQRSQPSPPTLRDRPIPVPTNNNDGTDEVEGATAPPSRNDHIGRLWESISGARVPSPFTTSTLFREFSYGFGNGANTPLDDSSDSD